MKKRYIAKFKEQAFKIIIINLYKNKYYKGIGNNDDNNKNNLFYNV